MESRHYRRQAALLITLGLAMKAKLGKPDVEALTSAMITVRLTFPDNDPLVSALDEFSTRFPIVSDQPKALADLGENLWRAVIRASWPRQDARLDLAG